MGINFYFLFFLGVILVEGVFWGLGLNYGFLFEIKWEVGSVEVS